MKEGDFVQFQVQRSSEGYPQAVNARRVRHLQGKVVRPAYHGGVDGTIIIRGDGSSPSTEGSDTSLQQLIGKEVRVRQEDCGQLRLAVDDEVAFCCRAATTETGPQVLEAQLVELLSTSRTGSALLGFFTLELPRMEAAEASGSVEAKKVCLKGHALADRLVLACLPRDLEAPELMRLFSKLGGSEAVVSHPDGNDGGFASVTFPGGPLDIARFLVRAAHTINEQGATQLARLSTGTGFGADTSGGPVLPALPAPMLSPVDGNALMVRWTQAKVSLAAGYYVELRPLAEDSKWSSVTVAAGVLEAQPGGIRLPAGLLGPQCTACRVDSIRADVPYEARVTYFTACGCQSQASPNSAPCSIATTAIAGSAATAVTATPPAQAFAGPKLEAEIAQPPMHAGVQMIPPSAGWRAPSGNLVPPPPPPELIPFDEVGGGRGILIQWPTVIHATAYTVELYEETTGTVERFHRAVPENLREVLVELRVGNLQPAGSYGACVRCVAPCGCESAPSPWSFAPPAWLSPVPAMGSWAPLPQQANGVPTQHPPPYLQPSPLLATNPGSAPAAFPPPPPAEPPSVEGAAEEAPIAPSTLVASGPAQVEAPEAKSGAEAAALVLD